MKNTGIVRKIDELGRIVIPKEIRNVLKINSGDDLEILTEDNKIYLQKYSVLENNKEESNKLLTSVKDLINGNIFITDKEKVITKGILENANLNKKLKEILNNRKEYISKEEEEIKFGTSLHKGYFIIEPIIQNSNANGLLILLKNDYINKEDILFMNILKNIEENN